MGNKVTGEARTSEELRQHYEIERGLAAKLRNASKAERRHLYTELYDELFRRVPRHPQVMKKSSEESSRQAVAAQMRYLEPYLSPGSAFLELGPGDCALSIEVCKHAAQVYAVDVSPEISRNSSVPSNFKLLLSDGCSVPVPSGSIDVAYSNQLMEHLHPDDAIEQLKNVHSALASGGVYVCITPNRLAGPHDISMYFDEVATGFHLKEYTLTELARLFRQAGFTDVSVLAGVRGRLIGLPILLAMAIETMLELLPHAIRRRIANGIPVRILMNACVIARRGGGA